MQADIGIIGALADEVAELISNLECHEIKRLGSVDFHTGKIFGKSVVIAKCGVGKVFAAICAEAMIIGFSPKLIVNTGVGGALARGLSVTDTVIADKLVQHDMDTSPIGDPSPRCAVPTPTPVWAFAEVLEPPRWRRWLCCSLG